jgi:hypothetical protein
MQLASLIVLGIAVASAGCSTPYSLSLEDAQEYNRALYRQCPVHEMGDTTGPYRALGGHQGPAGRFHCHVMVDGEKRSWAAPAEQGIEYVMERFENSQGNGFAIIYKLEARSQQQPAP